MDAWTRIKPTRHHQKPTTYNLNSLQPSISTCSLQAKTYNNNPKSNDKQATSNNAKTNNPESNPKSKNPTKGKRESLH